LSRQQGKQGASVVCSGGGDGDQVAGRPGRRKLDIGGSYANSTARGMKAPARRGSGWNCNCRAVRNRKQTQQPVLIVAGGHCERRGGDAG